MNARPQSPLAALLAAIVLAGCAATGRAAADRSATAGPGPSWFQAAGGGISSERAFVPSATGCLIAVTRFAPRDRRIQVPVLLAPGLLRDQRRLRGLALALAAQGIPAVTLNPCNVRPWDGRPVRTALDMIAVARWLKGGAVVYAGFSAGALAALIAGRLDPHARGVLALDLVDHQRLGVGMARALDPPLIGLAGAPAACNAYNNGFAVFARAPRARLTPIPGASHCDFESPTDWLCAAVCAGVDDRSPARRRAIIAATVAAATALIGPPTAGQRGQTGPAPDRRSGSISH